jgi:NAD(P)-dependent dehydrogenase (short-subunit alcohol dehydrogenase family)
VCWVRCRIDFLASKYAVVGLVGAAAKECSSGGVRVNALAP